MVYRIIFEEREITLDHNLEESCLQGFGFLDIHSVDNYEIGDTMEGQVMLHTELNDIIPKSLAYYSREDYVLATDVPDHLINNSEANGNFDIVEEYEKYDEAVNYIKNLTKITFNEIADVKSYYELKEEIEDFNESSQDEVVKEEEKKSDWWSNLTQEERDEFNRKSVRRAKCEWESNRKRKFVTDFSFLDPKEIEKRKRRENKLIQDYIEGIIKKYWWVIVLCLLLYRFLSNPN